MVKCKVCGFSKLSVECIDTETSVVDVKNANAVWFTGTEKERCRNILWSTGTLLSPPFLI
jgi:hypothetical protein